MKKMSVAVVALSLAVSLFSLANAGNNGMGGGCDKCAKQQAAPTTLTTAEALSDPFRKFQGDTIDLRQEMMLKRFEVQRENLKGTPDEAKITSLRAEIKALQAKILAIRSQSGLPGDKCDGECPQSMGDCSKAMGGDCGKGMGGCNKAPCGQK
ncbi:MAG: hypothetical protein ACOYL3_26635 [Desulfuromonadaceae bacterium]